ncbi:hypothetical protein BDV59DRAFT_147714 [Aspergillus ambiguus]|uniref:uncharacterized protein n=1 Tax=Aspergillus ambiguus TaxID=176160 RepID=UPI003CCDA415
MANMNHLPRWLLPKVCDYGGSTALAVFFLCHVDNSKISEICQRICSADTAWTDRPDGEPRPVVPVPWMHSQIPSLSIVFDIGGTIFIDDESVAEGTAIVRSFSNAARVPLNRVNLIVQALEKQTQSFETLVFPETVFSVEESREDRTDPAHSEEVEHPRPLHHHVPEYLTLEPTTLTLISLVYLSDNDIIHIKSSIGISDEVPNVVVYNWPDRENPRSRAHLYRLFTMIMPDIHECDETFALFIDRKWNEPDSYHILCAHKWTRKRNQAGVSEDVDINHIHIREVNTTLFNSQVNLYGTYSENVANPDKLEVSADYVVFILAPLTEVDRRLVHSYLENNVQNEFCLYDVSNKLKSPDMEGLIDYFTTEDFARTNQCPPSFFIAVDIDTRDIARSIINQMLSKKEEIDQSAALLVASNEPLSLSFMDDMECSVAETSLGYAYSRQDPEDAFSTCVNLSVGNMYFVDCARVVDWVTWSSLDEWLESNPIIDELEEFGAYITKAGAYYSGETEMREIECL